MSKIVLQNCYCSYTVESTSALFVFLRICCSAADDMNEIDFHSTG